MKTIIFLLGFIPSLVLAQSDGSGKIMPEPMVPLSQLDWVKELRVQIQTDKKLKTKKGQPERMREWFDFLGEDSRTYRMQREYLQGSYFYDESFVFVSPDELLEMDLTAYAYRAQHVGKNIEMRVERVNEAALVLHGDVKVYDAYSGLLSATLQFEHGRPTSIFINHYYATNQLQFVRHITTDGQGYPWATTSVLEAYYPDGSRFDHPLNNDGTAILILNEAGEVEDECPCIGQNIMEWGRSYLYSLLGKYAFLMERIYQEERLECCWE